MILDNKGRGQDLTMDTEKEDLVINRTELVKKRDRITVEDLKKDHIADIAEGQGHLVDQGRGHRIAGDNMA